MAQPTYTPWPGLFPSVEEEQLPLDPLGQALFPNFKIGPGLDLVSAAQAGAEAEANKKIPWYGDQVPTLPPVQKPAPAPLKPDAISGADLQAPAPAPVAAPAPGPADAVAPTDYKGLLQATPDITDAFVQRQKELDEREANTAAQEAADQQRIAAEQEEQLRFAAEEHEKRTSRIQKKMDENEARSRTEIDPKRAWKDAGSLRSIGAAIGIAIGGALQVKRGIPNAALAAVNATIERDIAAQQADVSNAQNLYKLNLDQYGNEQAAYNMTRARLQEDAARLFQQAGLKYTDPRTQIALDRNALELDKQAHQSKLGVANELYKLDEAEKAADLNTLKVVSGLGGKGGKSSGGGSGGSGSGSSVSSGDYYNPKTDGPPRAGMNFHPDDANTLTLGSAGNRKVIGYIKDPADKAEARAVLKDASAVYSQITGMQRLIEQYRKDWSTEDEWYNSLSVTQRLASEKGRKIKAARATLANALLNERSGAAVTDQELKRLLQEMPDVDGLFSQDPSGVWEQWSDNLATVLDEKLGVYIIPDASYSSQQFKLQPGNSQNANKSAGSRGEAINRTSGIITDPNTNPRERRKNVDIYVKNATANSKTIGDFNGHAKYLEALAAEPAVAQDKEGQAYILAMALDLRTKAKALEEKEAKDKRASEERKAREAKEKEQEQERIRAKVDKSARSNVGNPSAAGRRQ